MLICFQGDIGLNVAQMIVELIRDNRKIVDRITQNQIEMFVGLLRENKVSKDKRLKYANILSALVLLN